jgi:hypothetical protein
MHGTRQGAVFVQGGTPETYTTMEGTVCVSRSPPIASLEPEQVPGCATHAAGRLDPRERSDDHAATRCIAPAL